MAQMLSRKFRPHSELGPWATEPYLIQLVRLFRLRCVETIKGKWTIRPAEDPLEGAWQR
jgi:hypothetical protein